jgi:hypothetical protein
MCFIYVHVCLLPVFGFVFMRDPSFSLEYCVHHLVSIPNYILRFLSSVLISGFHTCTALFISEVEVEVTLQLTVSQYVLVSSTLVGLVTRYYFISAVET